MKKNLLVAISILLFNYLSAQRFGYIDSQVIVSKMTEYKEAENEIEKLSSGWQKEIERMKQEVNVLKDKYIANEITLTKEMKKIRLEEIDQKEANMLAYQNKTFGYEGLLFTKRQELIEPIQNKIFKAVEKVAKQKKLQILFDKSANLVMVYSDPIHNYTDYVLEALELGDPVDSPK